jgi:hypothetical protein
MLNTIVHILELSFVSTANVCDTSIKLPLAGMMGKLSLLQVIPLNRLGVSTFHLRYQAQAATFAVFPGFVDHAHKGSECCVLRDQSCGQL